MPISGHDGISTLSGVTRPSNGMAASEPKPLTLPAVDDQHHQTAIDDPPGGEKIDGGHSRMALIHEQELAEDQGNRLLLAAGAVFRNRPRPADPSPRQIPCYQGN
jgi:hypothetical protein